MPKPRKRPTQDEIDANRRARSLRWYHKNKEKLAAKRLAQTDAERQRLAERRHAYYEANPEIWQRTNRRRAAAKRARFVDDVDRLVVLEMDDGVCGICGEDVDPMDFHVDHIVPLSRGGEHSYANSQSAHPRCNRRKYNHSMLEAA